MAFSFGNKNRSLARAANAQRDKNNWDAAAELYREYLGREGKNAQTFAYIVQLGNCLKEAGRYEEALVAYNDAECIDGRNADLYLQRGHLFKLMQNYPAAAYAYQKAYNLDPGNEYAKHEIEAGGALAISGLDLPVGDQNLRTIWFDVTDFIEYARHNVSLSGIQRVCANLVLYVEKLKLSGFRVIPVLPDYGRKEVLSVTMGSFLKLVNAFDEEVVNHERIIKDVQKVIDSRTLVYPTKGDIFMVAGAFWIFDNYDMIMDIRRDGIKFGLFIHDLIQIRDEDYVMPDAKDRFQVHFSDAIDVCDFVLTNSQYVAGDVERYLQEAKGRHIPVKAVVLPTELKVTQSRNIPRNKNIKFIGNTEYVLCVSTIEVRKNHSLLISVWEKLFEELGDKTPYLVLVGKWGWQIDEFRKYIEEKGYVGDWLFIFNGISDVEMEYLYRHSLFTVYPSFAEGFGLPIGESLVYGKPCIASNTTSMPEVGGDFVRYIDPFDWKAAYPTIRQPIFDRADLKQWTERIQQEFKPKRWADFCEEFFHAVVDCAEETDNNEVSSLVPLPPNLLINGGDYDILIGALEKKPLITFRAARFNNWHPSEHWGVWSSDRRCEISFRSPFSEGETADIFFQLRRAPSQDLDPFVIVDAGLGKQKITLTEHPTFYRFTGVVGENGSLHIRFLARGKFPANDGRGIYIGWSGLAYCRHDDPAAQAVTLAALVPSGTSLQTTNLN